MSVKINGHDAPQALNFIETSFKHIAPGIPYEYQFLDDHFKEVYEVDAQVSQIVSIMAGLVIIISCLGLFGLASYSAEKRFKEIGVRKVLGASVNSITLLLSGNFLKLVLIANLIAWPIAWFYHEQVAAGFCIPYQYPLVGVRNGGYRIRFNRIVNHKLSICKSCGGKPGEKFKERMILSELEFMELKN